MSLPRGFGYSEDEFQKWKKEREFNERDPPRKKCILGKVCDDSYKSERCTVHKWTWKHDEAWMLIRIFLFVVIGGTILLACIAIGLYFVDMEAEPYMKNIDGYNCKQLAEYVANLNPQYRYAEHRYEWLCVNEQVKEFQG
jgi:hypothetical protein